MPVFLVVRIRSGLDPAEFERRLQERRPRFLEVPGLLQKVYGRDPATGDICALYFFDSVEALDAFRGTDLARSLADAYEAVDIRREAFDLLFPLRPEVGPYPEGEASRSR